MELKPGKRTGKRERAVLPVLISGIDEAGNSFDEVAHTLDVSESGVRLASVHRQLKPQSLLEIRRKHHKAQYRVVWVKAMPGTAKEFQVGVTCVQSVKQMWEIDFKPEEWTDIYESPEEQRAADVPTRVHNLLKELSSLWDELRLSGARPEVCERFEQALGLLRGANIRTPGSLSRFGSKPVPCLAAMPPLK
jgi:hypothetical protein